jgi:chromosome segregation protein
MRFTRLRLSGFKSFVEPTEIVIESGLTGIVGPNGCGKSNLLEALRWVMGESSYKNMRASGMDDVIFSGTANRPSRNMAEVSITLDNGSRTAPPPFNDQDTVEVSRRIEREAGSAYRINGRDVRGRDVQLLFADASTGARSPALVRQGQIGELINAKPQSRRRILEEAAGIAGLHTRRHEAELKLKAAETNLKRVEDVVGQLEIQLAGLKRQVRQASRYKNISAEIRKLEAAQVFRTWQETRDAVLKEQARLDAATRALGEHTRIVSEATRARLAAAEVLPGLRQEATLQTAGLQRLIHARQSIDEEEVRIKSRQAETQVHLAETERDLEREQERLGDAAAILMGLNREETALLASQTDEAKRKVEAERELRLASERLAQSQEQLDSLSVGVSELTARRDSLRHLAGQQRDRLERLEREIAVIAEQRDQLIRDGNEASALPALGEAVEAAASTFRQAETHAAEAERESEEAAGRAAAARAGFEEARRHTERLETEIATLITFLQADDSGSWSPVSDALTVKPGYEAALAAALGNELDAPTDEGAPVHWRSLPPLEHIAVLPDGTEPLDGFVMAPKGLDRRLRHVGVVDAARGAELQSRLSPGQGLVSREGHLWRWDGYTVSSEAQSLPARRLSERNRLPILEQEFTESRRLAEEARRKFLTLQDAQTSAQGRERTAREAWRAAITALDAARRVLQQQERTSAGRQQQISALEEAHRRLCQGSDEVRSELGQNQQRLDELASLEVIQAKLQAQRDMVARQRTAYGESHARHESLDREARLRADRLTAVGAEKGQWIERSERAGAQIVELEGRIAAAHRILEELKQAPEQIEEKRKKLLTLVGEAEAGQRQAGDALAAAEARFQAADGELRTANDKLSLTREEHARSDALMESGLARQREHERRIAEHFQCGPEALPGAAGFNPELVPVEETIEHKLGQLRDERERLGGVNLLAEEEAREVARQLDGLNAERADLAQAVTKLRNGIQSLNREGRHRLIEAFDTVNRNFGALFTTLFSGGKAELQLIESEDPLEAGLEILAHPPGKKPQVLSLLSGGEQALTALALIFAVFLTNPSPICVLDEVDAPLDDHNVERFCNLLDAMLERTETRFLIITHHALTMARMHRLFGVTMMERGVSQLVSVDLKAAEGLREAS